MKQEKCLFLLLMCAMTFTAFAWDGLTKAESFSGRMERAPLPSTMTSSGIVGRADNAIDNSMESAVRGNPPPAIRFNPGLRAADLYY